MCSLRFWRDFSHICSYKSKLSSEAAAPTHCSKYKRSTEQILSKRLRKRKVYFHFSSYVMLVNWSFYSLQKNIMVSSWFLNHFLFVYKMLSISRNAYLQRITKNCRYEIQHKIRLSRRPDVNRKKSCAKN